jgi:hypothetical protein
MDVDGGVGGLAQSRHHPNAGIGGYSAAPYNDESTAQWEPEHSYNLWVEIDELTCLLERGERGNAALTLCCSRSC